MPTDEATLPKERKENDHYERHLAAEIVSMLPEARDDALRVLALVDAILNVTPEPLPSEPRLPDAA